MTCTSGASLLTPYGWVYRPGSCYDYSWTGGWTSANSLASYRRGASLVRVGPILLALGGRRRARSYNSVEVFDSRSPHSSWKVSRLLQMPAGVSEHCSVVVPGRSTREVVVTGGRGRGNRVLKLNLKTSRWYSLHRMETSRRRHACTKVTLNGRPGLVVSGGVSSSSKNLTSVEFYDSASGQWASLPDLQRGRRSHAMLVHNGRLTVTGGVQADGRLMKDSEEFDGKRWIDSRSNLREPRQGFSLIKVPASRFSKRRRPRSRALSNRNTNGAGRRRERRQG